MTTETQPSRYAGTYRKDGKELYFNVEAESEEQTINKLINLNPGCIISEVKAALCAPARYWEG